MAVSPEIDEIEGTPAASPSIPTAPANSIVLAQIAVNAAVSSITSADITDVRPMAALELNAVPSPTTTRTTKTYGVSGPLAVASGGANYLPPFFMPVPSGQSENLVGIRAVIRAGTSATITIDQNGSAITGLTGINVTTTATTTLLGTPVAVADGDAFAPVITAVSGTPDGLSLSFEFDVTV